MKKKIIFVTKALWIGGIETALVNMLSRFDYDRYDVTLLVLKAELDMLPCIDPRCRVLIADRKQTLSFRRPYRYFRLFGLTETGEKPSRLHRAMMFAVPAVRWAENRLYIRYIRDQMKEERFDTAVIFSDVAAETAIRAIRARKYIMYYHHGVMRHVYHDGVAYRKCRNIIAVSRDQAEALRAFVPEAADKICTIHNLIDTERILKLAEKSTEEEFPTDRFHIVSVGRIAAEKGMDMAARACVKLTALGCKDFCWWIVGDGPQMKALRELARELGVEDRLRLVGMQPNPYPYIRQADVYVQPSRAESFGLTLWEAFVLNRPIISTRTFGAEEMIDSPEKGTLCEADPDSLAETIFACYCNRNRSTVTDQKRAVQTVEERNRAVIERLEELL